jgi:hypothetical protein
MQRRYLVILILGGAIFAAACAQPIRPISAAAVSERVFQRNYTVGQPATVHVGEAVIRFKDYLVQKWRGNHMRPNADFRVHQALGPWIYARADSDYPVRSELEKDGVTYKAVGLTQVGDGYDAVLVAPDGSPYPKLLVQVTGQRKAFLMAGTAHFEPPAVRFVLGADEVTVDSAAGFTNYELLYGGTDGRSFTLTYREYTPQDLIKPAFTQTLTYENRSTVVRFRSVKLAIHEVTSEHLSYTVTEEGIPSQ